MASVDLVFIDPSRAHDIAEADMTAVLGGPSAPWIDPTPVKNVERPRAPAPTWPTFLDPRRRARLGRRSPISRVSAPHPEAELEDTDESDGTLGLVDKRRERPDRSVFLPFDPLPRHPTWPSAAAAVTSPHY